LSGQAGRWAKQAIPETGAHDHNGIFARDISFRKQRSACAAAMPTRKRNWGKPAHANLFRFRDAGQMKRHGAKCATAAKTSFWSLQS